MERAPLTLGLSTLPNPYDFANPVRDPALFAGRQEELSEIDYYLDQAHLASQPIRSHSFLSSLRGGWRCLGGAAMRRVEGLAAAPDAPDE
jgi:hypothetical protein